MCNSLSIKDLRVEKIEQQNKVKSVEEETEHTNYSQFE